MSAEDAQQLAELLQPRAGEYRLPQASELVFEVRKTEIKDSEGNVVQVIG